MIADIYEAVRARPILAAFEHYIGGEFLDVNTEAPRFVWVPGRDRFRPGRIQTGLTPGDRAAPHSILTRIAGVKIRLYAKKAAGEGNVADTVGEVRALEDMARKLLVAIEQLAWGSWTADDLVWTDDDGAPLIQYGRAADLNVTFEVPIYETLDEQGLTTAVAEAIEDTGEFGEDDEEPDGPIVLEPVSVAVTPADPTLAPAATLQLTATATYTDEEERDVTDLATWATTDAGVATVDDEGLLTAVAAGTCSVSATIHGIDSPPQLVTVT